jgi:hypothetical protein
MIRRKIGPRITEAQSAVGTSKTQTITTWLATRAPKRGAARKIIILAACKRGFRGE